MGVTFEEFVTARLPALLRYAHLLTGDPHTAADLVQDTLVKVHSRWRRVVAADRPELYVKRMLTNAFVDRQRGSWLRRVVLRPLPDDAGPPTADDHAVVSAERDEMWLLLARLPRQQRAALVLRYYEDLPDHEIGELLGCGAGAVRAYISRALATLRAHLTEAST